jgi:D-sedoheptulose 7-phosphate isomerase
MRFFKELAKLASRTLVTDNRNRRISIAKAESVLLSKLRYCRIKGYKVMLIGNGGSAAIASHIAADLLKNSGIPTLTFYEGSLLTCISNDLGYKEVFAKPLGFLAKAGDILFVVSSSGMSENILRAVACARKKGCFVVSLSGFSKDNQLRRLGDLNFWCPSYCYGLVETAHLAICHSLVDRLIKKEDG